MGLGWGTPSSAPLLPLPGQKGRMRQGPPAQLLRVCSSCVPQCSEHTNKQQDQFYQHRWAEDSPEEKENNDSWSLRRPASEMGAGVQCPKVAQTSLQSPPLPPPLTLLVVGPHQGLPTLEVKTGSSKESPNFSSSQPSHTPLALPLWGDTTTPLPWAQETGL